MTKASGCFDTGQSLNTLKNVILLEWERLVREVIKSSKHEPSVILQDHLPELLDQLAVVLRTGRVDEIEIGKCHGYHRSTLTDFCVSDLITEYSLLREILITYLYPMGDLACAMVIHKFIDIMTKHSVVEFINDQLVHRSIPIKPIGSELKEIRNNPVIPTIN